MQKFELVLKNEKEKTYRTISWIIIILNILSLITLSAVTGFQKLEGLIFAALTIFSLFASRYFKNKNKKRSFTGAFTILSIGWFSSPFWWMGFIVLFFGLLDLITRRELIIQVNPDEVIYPTWPQKHLKWFELNNVILKDELLTIDLKNNKLFQDKIINEIDEPMFNNFCKEQLNNAELYKLN
jgi:hypothetical protein